MKVKESFALNEGKSHTQTLQECNKDIQNKQIKVFFQPMLAACWKAKRESEDHILANICSRHYHMTNIFGKEPSNLFIIIFTVNQLFFFIKVDRIGEHFWIARPILTCSICNKPISLNNISCQHISLSRKIPLTKKTPVIIRKVTHKVIKSNLWQAPIYRWVWR